MPTLIYKTKIEKQLSVTRPDSLGVSSWGATVRATTNARTGGDPIPSGYRNLYDSPEWILRYDSYLTPDSTGVVVNGWCGTDLSNNDRINDQYKYADTHTWNALASTDGLSRREKRLRRSSVHKRNRQRDNNRHIYDRSAPANGSQTLEFKVEHDGSLWATLTSDIVDGPKRRATWNSAPGLIDPDHYRGDWETLMFRQRNDRVRVRLNNRNINMTASGTRPQKHFWCNNLHIDFLVERYPAVPFAGQTSMFISGT